MTSLSELTTWSGNINLAAASNGALNTRFSDSLMQVPNVFPSRHFYKNGSNSTAPLTLQALDPLAQLNPADTQLSA